MPKAANMKTASDVKEFSDRCASEGPAGVLSQQVVSFLRELPAEPAWTIETAVPGDRFRFKKHSGVSDERVVGEDRNVRDKQGRVTGSQDDCTYESEDVFDVRPVTRQELAKQLASARRDLDEAKQALANAKRYVEKLGDKLVTDHQQQHTLACAALKSCSCGGTA
jgi:hypothetical protein